MLTRRRLDPTNPSDTAADAAMQDAQDEVTFGGHFAMPAESLASWWTGNRYFDRDHLAIFDDGTLVGLVDVFLPLTENTDSIELEFSATPEFARRCRTPEALDAFCAAAEELRTRHGRRRSEVWASLPREDEDASALVPYPAIAERLGLTRRVTEIASGLDLPVDTRVLNDLAEEATTRMTSGGYRLVGWIGAMPAEYRSSYGRLIYQLIADDQAFEGVQTEIPEHNEDRLVFRSELDEKLSKLRATTIALSDSGELVGATELNWYPSATLAEQDTTVVMPEHRGHRIGMALKIANLQRMTEHSPGLRRVITWNNHLNEHMLAINTAMGFSPIRETALFDTPDDT